ncbi:TPA: hypothetical protein QDB99_004505 [Burkholderia aenigmatica]|nr:hypothetical protein [Burkholderia aenigmatica]
MLNLSKSVVLILVFFAQIVMARAGEVIIFNDPNLIGFDDGRRVVGMYDAENEKFSCKFLFLAGDSHDAGSVMDDGYKNIKMLTFLPGEKSMKFPDRDKFFDVPANLYRRDDEWVIKTDTGQAGCENDTGTFTFDVNFIGAVHYFEEKKISALGIRIINRRSTFYDYNDGRFIARKGYLVNRNLVVALRQVGQFSFVRFVNPRIDTKNAGQVTTGWVRTENLVNPFPEAVESR